METELASKIHASLKNETMDEVPKKWCQLTLVVTFFFFFGLHMI
jgi:hypothetical protein